MTIDEERAAGRWPFCYGPVGDPNSSDPFEWAHARMEPGWHVEGQVVAGRWKATYHGEKGWRPVVASSKEELVEAVRRETIHLDVARAEFAVRDDRDLRALTTAVDAVRSLHYPVQERDFVAIPERMVTVCHECFAGSDDFHVDWPCDTIKAIDAALSKDPVPA